MTGFRITACALLAAAIVAGCSMSQPGSAAPTAAPAPTVSASVPAVTISARDFSFEMPDSLPSGWVALTLRNDGKFNHHGLAMRLKDGATLEQLLAAVGQEGAQPPADKSFFIPDTDSGQQNQATVELAPGNWVLLSVARGNPADPTPDFAKGSVKAFTVTEAGSGSAPPVADATLSIGKDNYTIPELSAGTHTLKIANASGSPDGWAFIIKLGNDTKAADILPAFNALFGGQAPAKMPNFRPVGGLMGYNLGSSFYTTLNLEPGNYAVIASVGAQGFPYTGLTKSFEVK